MKFAFEADLDYQRAAIDAVVDLFKGEDSLTSRFTVHADPGSDGYLPGTGLSGTGVANRLSLDPDTLLENLQSIQEREGLAAEHTLGSMNLTVEMETGTGKTYVYLRTLYELHDRYGFTKFIVVVPSVAIKEGVLSSLEMLRDHLGALYANPPMQYFPYDGTNPSRIRSFATSSGIEIMVMTVGSLNKASNTIFKPTESLGNEIPVDLIRETRPIVVVDEPQSVYGDDGNPRKKKGAGRLGIEKLGPLAVLRYSATHPRFDRGNLVYRLDAIAAYEKQLVKQIEVDSLVTESGGTTPYVQLKSVSRSGGRFTARVEVDVDTGTGVRRRTVTVRDGDNLADATDRPLYSNLTVSALGVSPEYLRFDTVSQALSPGESIGAEVSVHERARQMIAQTIRQHLRKEEEFRVHGRDIKVLSLLFVGSVSTYRQYDEHGEAQLGEYARIFEEEYARITAEPEFTTLLGTRGADVVAAEAHQGYFSVDRNKRSGAERFVETSEKTVAGRQQAEAAYEQIMKRKAWLTTPGTPIRFIFTHSALQEGWDNPNVFQICVLRNMGSERWRRQSVGRGLRLCVDGSGNRVHGFDVNRLTVIANESYEEFAEQLQHELAEDLGIEFGLVTVDGIARIEFKDAATGQQAKVGAAAAESIFTALLAEGYVDPSGKVQDSLRIAVQQDSPELTNLVSDVVPDVAGQIRVLGLIKRLARPIDIKRAADRKLVPLVQERLEDPEFQALWDSISHRTEYRLDVDESTLRGKLVDALRSMTAVPARKGEWQTSRVEKIDQSGLVADVTAIRRASVVYADSDNLPDILSVLADRTQLTRTTIAYVLVESGTLPQFARNPQVYVDRVSRLMNETKEALVVQRVRYDLVPDDRPEDERRYPLSLLQTADLQGYEGVGGNIISDADGNAVSFAAKSPYRHIVVQSGIERQFALDLLPREDVVAFVKLPDAFTISTPLGSYIPDWAVLARRPDGTKYIVFETKGTPNIDELRTRERGKILAARVHFDTVRERVGIPNLEYQTVETMQDVDGVLDGVPS